jgi:hypothetical protein
MRAPRREPRRGPRGPSLGRRGAAVVALALVAGLTTPAAVGFAATDEGAQACAPPPAAVGLAAYRDLDRLSYLDLSSRAATATTADPGGSNDDRSHVLGSTGDARQLMDVAGPGVVTFLRMQESWGGPWTVERDGEADQLSIDAVGAPDVDDRFPFPLALAPDQSEGSTIVATPMSFASSFRFASTSRNGNFYALYRKLPLGEVHRHSTADRAAVDQAAVTAGLRDGLHPLPAATPRRTGTLAIHPGENLVAQIGRGPRQLRDITFRVPRADAVAFANQRVRISWDDERQPSVDAPLKYLVGAGGGIYEPARGPLVRSYLSSAESDGDTMSFVVRWPMPFRSNARITISSTVALPHVSWTVAHERVTAPRGWWAPFHASFTDIEHPMPGEDLTFLDVVGSGRIVGTVVNFGTVGVTLEGDPHVYLDGSRTPQVTLTGTEEWGLGGNYWRSGEQTTLPLGGFPTSDRNGLDGDVDGAALYRYLLADSIPFNASAVVRWEHGGTNDVAQRYRAVVLWYGTPVVTAHTTDVLAPADDDSARTHHLRAAGSAEVRVSGGYGYAVRAATTTASGLRTSASVQFDLAIDPRNAGVLLRRQLDTAVPDQRARVYVDGHLAGVWLNAGVYSGVGVDGRERRWQDDEILLSRRLTAGKRSISVRVVPEAIDGRATDWTMFELRAASMVPICR